MDRAVTFTTMGMSLKVNGKMTWNLLGITGLETGISLKGSSSKINLVLVYWGTLMAKFMKGSLRMAWGMGLEVIETRMVNLCVRDTGKMMTFSQVTEID